MADANKTQVGGTHYQAGDKPQHWDIVAMHDLDYFQGQITKYVMRWKKKNGIQDLEKAAHFLQKYIELNRPAPPARGLDLQDNPPLYGANPPGFNSLTPLHPAMNAEAYNDHAFQCEGYYGDGTELYRCKHCRDMVRARGLAGAYAGHAQPCTLPGVLPPLPGAV